MLADECVAAALRRAAGLLAVAIVLGATVLSLAAPAAAVPLPNGGLSTSDAMLKWINAYRGKPEPDGLPVLVQTLSGMQAFKDAESSGAYIGFIAGVLGANPDRAGELIARMLPIAPADHWVLVRAIAYSGLPNWKELLATFVDRMPTRRAMIDKYLDGKLPTLDQIAYRIEKPGVMDKIKYVLTFGTDRGEKKEIAIEPSPELIDLLWGYYLATGAFQPIGHIVKLLPLANDKDNVDNLTTGSAAKFTLASNAVRDLHLLAHAQMGGEDRAEGGRRGAQRRDRDGGDGRYRAHAQGIAGRDRGAQAEGPELQARALGLGPGRARRAVDGLRRRCGDRADRARHSLRDRRRRLLSRTAIYFALVHPPRFAGEDRQPRPTAGAGDRPKLLIRRKRSRQFGRQCPHRLRCQPRPQPCMTWVIWSVFSTAWEIAWPLAGAAEAATLPTKLTPAAMTIASTR